MLPEECAKAETEDFCGDEMALPLLADDHSKALL
jgi:hypothetical protein